MSINAQGKVVVKHSYLRWNVIPCFGMFFTIICCSQIQLPPVHGFYVGHLNIMKDLLDGLFLVPSPPVQGAGQVIPCAKGNYGNGWFPMLFPDNIVNL